ncbi:MAG: M3 family oligoendopeptidase [Oscillospiraceae bacterium]|nr:M3 family oligoendopeptidase [Oscillospiraceae bacterium]
MKFSEMPYTRPNYSALFQQIDAMTAQLSSASAEKQLEIYHQMEKLESTVVTQATICEIRNSINTRDQFYEAEQAYNDEHSPMLDEHMQAFKKALLHSTHRTELEKALGSMLFQKLEMEQKSFSPEIVPLLQEENHLVNAYQKLYASAAISFDGKTCTLSQLGPYLQNTDRSVRRSAAEAYGGFFDAHREEFDTLYDKMVKNRTEQAHKLGFANFEELSLLRRNRIGYSIEDIRSFRKEVVRDLVPITVEIKKRQAKRIEIPDFSFYDNELKFKDGSAVPQGTPKEIMQAGKKMYTELSAETAEFIDQMFRMDLFDVLAKKGKAPGGYCTDLPDYHCSFIFSNFNGTSGDVDVLTHEAGHAFASFIAQRTVPLLALRDPSYETAETHSMSMEFLTAPWHSLFFGDQTDKYELTHAEDALTFIPYGCLVDHFQEEVYLHPEMTPEERNQTWLRLEKLYRPYVNFADLPFFARGAGWQRQLHIYMDPFYYIDYCLAQTMSLQFFNASNYDRKDTWKRYIKFVKQGGTASFVDLAHSVGFRSPLDKGCVYSVCQETAKWLEVHAVQ